MRVDSCVCAHNATTRPEDLAGLARRAVDVEDAARAARVGIDQHLVDHRAGDERAPARRNGVGHRRIRRVEVRVRHAAVLAGPAVVARLAPVRGLGEVRRPALRQRAPECLLDPVAQRGLRAGHRHRRLELAVGQPWQAFGHPLDADVLLDQVVERFDVLVADRPIRAVAVVRGRLEFQIADPQRLAAPDVGAAAHEAWADPEELRVGFVHVRLVDVVDEPARVPLADGIGNRLNRTFPRERPLRLRAVLQLECLHVLAVVGVGELASGLEHRDAQAGFREALGGPPARGAGSNDDDVEGLISHARILTGPWVHGSMGP